MVGGGRGSNPARRSRPSLVLANGHLQCKELRLRSTQLVTHIAIGTRSPDLARAAGLQGDTVLSDLLPLVPHFALTTTRLGRC